MPKIKLFNNIAQIGLDQFTNEYEINENTNDEDAILVRSANLHNIEYSQNLKAIVRAGAGVNNIDIDTCTKKGIAVFNTPGANSNAVKELVFAGMLLASRDIYHGIEWIQTQKENDNVAKDVEKQKKKYAGHELSGKSLGVIGCGAIGIQVANLALRFGMKVYGYDPYMSVDAAWNLSRYVNHVTNIDDLYRQCDFITIHIPLNDGTKNFINKDSFEKMRDGVNLLNFARGGLIDEDALLEAINTNKVDCYVTDFPTQKIIQNDKVIAIPHLGASTEESEENCAIKAAQELMDYLTYGNISNSVNLPNAKMEMNSPFRITCIHENKPKMISQITDILKDANIENLMNKSKKDIAYTIIDLDSKIDISKIKNIQGMIRVTTFEA
jgi:D-3-phosphoglycerate dehydrogenase / 2-oxoglutarate reductase